MFKYLSVSFISLFLGGVAGFFICLKNVEFTKNGETKSFDVYAKQVNMWYQTASAIKSSISGNAPAQHMLDSAIVENYFPLFLEEKRMGEVSSYHLKLARKAAISVNLETVWSVEESNFQGLVEYGLLSAHGFQKSDISSFDNFLRLKNEYFTELKK